MHMAVRWLMVMATMILGTSAMATGARNAALNLDRWRMLDSTSIQLTPADMLSFQKIVYGELGTSTSFADDYATVFVPLGPGLLGVYAGAIPVTGAVTLLGMGDDATLSSIAVSAFGSVPSMNVPQNGLLTSNAVHGRIRALYGMEIAGGMRFAGGVSYYSRTSMEDSFHSKNVLVTPSDQGTTTLKDSSSVLNIHAGANLPLGPINPLAVGVEVGLPSFEAVNTYPDGKTDSYKSDSGMDLNINVRGRMPNLVGKDVDTMAFASFGTGSLEGSSASRAFVAAPAPGFFATFDDGKKTIEQGHITIGASNNHKLGDGTVAFYSITLESSSSSVEVVDTLAPIVTTTKSETSVTDVPIVIGIETRLAKWIVFRFSSKSSIMTKTTTDYTQKGGLVGLQNTDQTIVDDSSSQTFALGLTLDVSDRLSVEGVLTESLLFAGPNFVGGLAPGFFGRVSLIARI